MVLQEERVELAHIAGRPSHLRCRTGEGQAACSFRPTLNCAAEKERPVERKGKCKHKLGEHGNMAPQCPQGGMNNQYRKQPIRTESSTH